MLSKILKKILVSKTTKQSSGLAIALFTCLNFASSLSAETLRVGTKPFAPFAFVQEGEYIGFSIELWSEIAKELNIEYELYGEKTVTDLLNSVSSGNTDVAIAGITITSDREKNVDFSHSFFESGLQILVPVNAPASPVNNFILLIFSPILLETIGVLLLVIIISAHLLWFFERDRNPEFPKEYFKGIWEACWWSVVTVVTVGYGDKAPTGIGGRIVATIWMFTGVLLVSYFTASVSSALTVQKLETSIQGLEDLNGKRVATVEGSTAADYLTNRPAVRKVEYELVEEAFDTLKESQVDAVVYDAPVLKNYVLQEGVDKVSVVGAVFERQSYGIALKTNSPYREPINRAILELIENGTYDKIYQKWFGEIE